MTRCEGGTNNEQANGASRVSLKKGKKQEEGEATQLVRQESAARMFLLQLNMSKGPLVETCT